MKDKKRQQNTQPNLDRDGNRNIHTHRKIVRDKDSYLQNQAKINR